MTKVVEPIPSGQQLSLEWEVQAVNAGDFAVYVSLVPASGRGPVIAGQPMRVTVASRRSLNSGGVLPVALAMPAFWMVVASSDHLIDPPADRLSGDSQLVPARW